MPDRFQNELSLLGYSMTIHRIMPDDFEKHKLPLSFRMENTAAILCAEVFDVSYCRMLCSLGLPVLLVDAPADIHAAPLPAGLYDRSANSGIILLIPGDVPG